MVYDLKLFFYKDWLNLYNCEIVKGWVYVVMCLKKLERKVYVIKYLYIFLDCWVVDKVFIDII